MGTGGQWIATTGPSAMAQESATETAAPTWHMRDVKWSGKRTISGRLALVGAQFMRVGGVEAEVVDKERIEGTISNQAGDEVGLLRAQVTEKGLLGEFVSSSDEVECGSGKQRTLRRS